MSESINFDIVMLNRWLVIVNPNAGKKKGKTDWQKISNLLINNEISFKEVFTNSKNHAHQLAIEYIKKDFRKIIVIGGDGTLNEVANGILTQNHCNSSDITLAMIPVGTGNDWSKTFNIPNDYESLVKGIKIENTILQDVGLVKYYNSDKIAERYFVNVAGVGFDADVAKRTNQSKDNGRGGTLAYLRNLLLCLFSSQSIGYKITIDKKTFDRIVFSLVVGIGKYNGNGMMQLPNAIPNDGLFDITIIKKIGKLKVIRNVKKLYDGSFVKISNVELSKGKSLIIETEKPVNLETDGESIGVSPFEFKILPKAINVVCGNNYKH